MESLEGVLGGLLRVLGTHLGCLWGSLEGSWAAFGGPWGALGLPLGASGALMGAFLAPCALPGPIFGVQKRFWRMFRGIYVFSCVFHVFQQNGSILVHFRRY